MSLSPAPFVRIGFAILAISLALSLWLGQAPSQGWWAALPAAIAFLAVTGLGELIFRRVATPAQIRADLEDRVHNGD